MPHDRVRVNVDGTLLRGFMTYIIRRHDGSDRQASWTVTRFHVNDSTSASRVICRLPVEQLRILQ